MQKREESKGQFCSQWTPHYRCVREAEAQTDHQEVEKCFLDTSGRIRKAKEQLELELLKDIQVNGKGFYGHNSNKRKTGENVALLPNVVGDQVMENMEKDNLVKDSMSSLLQRLLAKSAAHSQAFQVFA